MEVNIDGIDLLYAKSKIDSLGLTIFEQILLISL